VYGSGVDNGRRFTPWQRFLLKIYCKENTYSMLEYK